MKSFRKCLIGGLIFGFVVALAGCTSGANFTGESTTVTPPSSVPTGGGGGITPVTDEGSGAVQVATSSTKVILKILGIDVAMFGEEGLVALTDVSKQLAGPPVVEKFSSTTYGCPAGGIVTVLGGERKLVPGSGVCSIFLMAEMEFKDCKADNETENGETIVDVIVNYACTNATAPDLTGVTDAQLLVYESSLNGLTAGFSDSDLEFNVTMLDFMGILSAGGVTIKVNSARVNDINCVRNIAGGIDCGVGLPKNRLCPTIQTQDEYGNPAEEVETKCRVGETGNTQCKDLFPSKTDSASAYCAGASIQANGCCVPYAEENDWCGPFSDSSNKSYHRWECAVDGQNTYVGKSTATFNGMPLDQLVCADGQYQAASCTDEGICRHGAKCIKGVCRCGIYTGPVEQFCTYTDGVPDCENIMCCYQEPKMCITGPSASQVCKDMAKCGDGTCSMFEDGGFSQIGIPYCAADCCTGIYENGNQKCSWGDRENNCELECGVATCNLNDICEYEPPDKNETAESCTPDCCKGACGNGICETAQPTSEYEYNCPSDCGCNKDGICQPERGETMLNCPTDNCLCGNGICEDQEKQTADGNPEYCILDCPCGNGTCQQDLGEDVPPPESNNSCVRTDPNDPTTGDCFCGDNVCSSAMGENKDTCFADCHCGNGTCEQGVEYEPRKYIYEDSTSCPEDCFNKCGVDADGDKNYCDNFSPYWEYSGNCLKDCPSCENGLCEPYLGEDDPSNSNYCTSDCPKCGDGYCSSKMGETAENCIEDCHCGNDICDDGKDGRPYHNENWSMCWHDCGAGRCGDGYCEQSDWYDYVDGVYTKVADAENYNNCPSDCLCGNGTCEQGLYDVGSGNPPWTDYIYEQSGNCPLDCPGLTCEDGDHPQDCPRCGDGTCETYPAYDNSPAEDFSNCPADCRCLENGICEDGNYPNPNYGETTQTCAADCHCGNGTCDNGTNGTQNLGEDQWSCKIDCPPCGNGICEPQNCENVVTCPKSPPADSKMRPGDCFCGDHVCDYYENDATIVRNDSSDPYYCTQDCATQPAPTCLTSAACTIEGNVIVKSGEDFIDSGKTCDEYGYGACSVPTGAPQGCCGETRCPNTYEIPGTPPKTRAWSCEAAKFITDNTDADAACATAPNGSEGMVCDQDTKCCVAGGGGCNVPCDKNGIADLGDKGPPYPMTCYAFGFGSSGTGCTDSCCDTQARCEMITMGTPPDTMDFPGSCYLSGLVAMMVTQGCGDGSCDEGEFCPEDCGPPTADQGCQFVKNDPSAYCDVTSWCCVSSGGSQSCNYTGSEDSDGACVDGIDNDCDGYIDCLDSDCAATQACSGGGGGTACRAFTAEEEFGEGWFVDDPEIPYPITCYDLGIGTDNNPDYYGCDPDNHVCGGEQRCQPISAGSDTLPGSCGFADLFCSLITMDYGTCMDIMGDAGMCANINTECSNWDYNGCMAVVGDDAICSALSCITDFCAGDTCSLLGSYSCDANDCCVGPQ